LSVTVATLEARLTANTRDFDKGIDRSQGKMSGAHKVMLGAAVGIAGGIGFMASKAVSAAADYESSLNTMQAVSGATGDQMKEISKLAIKLGNDVSLPGTSAKDASEAMTELSKAGMSVNQTMKAVRPTLVLSAAAQISNARAAEITSNALNAFGLDASKTTRVVDFLANAANASSLDIEDAAESMKMAGAVFSGFQGPVVGAEEALKQLTTATALLGNAGIKGSDAGTSLKQALLQLTGPAEKSKDAMKALYYAAQSATISEEQMTYAARGTKKVRHEALEEIEKHNKQLEMGGDIAFDAAGKMRPLNEIVALVTKGTRDMTQEQRAYYVTQIFGADASRAIIALMKQGSEGWDDMSDKIGKAGAAQELAAAKMKGLRGAQEALNSTLDTLAITFGMVLLPYVTRATQELNKMVAVMAEHKTAVMVLTGVLLTLSATVLAAWTITKLHAAAVLVQTAAVAAWSAATTIATAAQWLLNAALEANPIGLVVLALVALGAALVVAWQKSETFRDIVKGALRGVEVVAEDLRLAFVKVKNWMADNWPLIATIISGPFAPLVALATNAFGVRSALVDSFVAIKTHTKDLVDDIVGFWADLPGRVADAVRGKADELWDGVRHIFDKLPGFIRDALGIHSPSRVFVEIGEAIIAGAIKGIEGKAGDLVGAAQSAFAGVAGTAAKAVGSVGAAVFQGGGGTNVELGKAMAAARGWTGAQWDALYQLFQGESGWNNLARNPSSGAYGIPQALPESKLPYGGTRAGGSQAAAQIQWGMDYIASRYGTPSAALAAWASRSPHWYGEGGIFTRPTVIGVGERGPEAVVPLNRMGPTINVTVNGVVGDAEDVARKIQSALIRIGRRNGPGILGGFA
jgi:TP901 family phage tail tape measure protein